MAKNQKPFLHQTALRIISSKNMIMYYVLKYYVRLINVHIILQLEYIKYTNKDLFHLLSRH